MAKEFVRHPHVAIMKEEVVDALITNKSGTYLDFTVGFGGHANHIVQNLDKIETNLNIFSFSDNI